MKMYIHEHMVVFICIYVYIHAYMTIYIGEVFWSLNLNHEMRQRKRQSYNSKRVKKVTSNVEVHVEGSAACNIDGSLVFIGCFLGTDVDNNNHNNDSDSDNDNDSDNDSDDNYMDHKNVDKNTIDEQHNNPYPYQRTNSRGRNDEYDHTSNSVFCQGKDYVRGLGNVLAITASTGKVVWKTPLGGEVKGAPVGIYIYICI
jgi:outer membrane protein assembly factor BamB